MELDKTTVDDYMNELIDIRKCNNDCVLISRPKGQYVQDTWIKNQCKGWCRDRYDNYSLFYYHNNPIMRKVYSNNRAEMIVDNKTYPIVKNPSNTVFECESDVVFYCDGEGYHKLIDQGKYCICGHSNSSNPSLDSQFRMFLFLVLVWC